VLQNARTRLQAGGRQMGVGQAWQAWQAWEGTNLARLPKWAANRGGGDLTPASWNCLDWDGSLKHAGPLHC